MCGENCVLAGLFYVPGAALGIAVTPGRDGKPDRITLGRDEVTPKK